MHVLHTPIEKSLFLVLLVLAHRRLLLGNRDIFDGLVGIDVVSLADVVQEQLELGGIVLLGKVGEILLQVDLVEGGNHRDRELVQHPDYLGHRPMEDL